MHNNNRSEFDFHHDPSTKNKIPKVMEKKNKKGRYIRVPL